MAGYTSGSAGAENHQSQHRRVVDRGWGIMGAVAYDPEEPFVNNPAENSVNIRDFRSRISQQIRLTG
jgi:hypothetical protein